MPASFPALPAIRLPAAYASRRYALRPARPADATFERRLFESARPDAKALAAWPAATRKAFLDQQFQFQRTDYARQYPHAERLIVTARRMAVGRLIVDRAADPWRIVDIALLPAARGQGLGSALLSAVMAAATGASVTLALSVEIGNPAFGLYERLGFVPAGLANQYRKMEWRPSPRSQDDDGSPQLKTA